MHQGPNLKMLIIFTSLFSNFSISGQRFDQSVRNATKVPASMRPCCCSQSSKCLRDTIKSEFCAASLE